jgi:hypothetical protein
MLVVLACAYLVPALVFGCPTPQALRRARPRADHSAGSLFFIWRPSAAGMPFYGPLEHSLPAQPGARNSPPNPPGGCPAWVLAASR